MNDLNQSIIFGDFINNTYQVFCEPIFCAIGFSNFSYFEDFKDGSITRYDDTFGSLENALAIQESTGLYLVGAFSYELGNIIEEIKTDISPSYFPLFAVYGFNQPSLRGRKEVGKLLSNTRGTKVNINLRELEKHSNFTKEVYLDSIIAIKKLIVEGEVYQVNLSQQFTLPFPACSLKYFLALQKNHPSTYSCYFPIRTKVKNYGTIVSHSPELFLKRTGATILTRPIKGTRKRGRDRFQDEKLKQELMTSDKDLAELSMIVDIERNDLGKICNIGSIKVISHAQLIERSNVFHLESEISGKLNIGVDFIDIMKALFPSGSITGAPKIAAQNIIAKIENSNREIYTGAIGLISPNSDFDLNVAIRSCLFNNNQIKFNSGGGIVHESNPEDEWIETLHKAKGLFETWKILQPF